MAWPVRSSSNNYNSLFNSWCCRLECYHDLLDCLEIVHLARGPQSQRVKNSVHAWQSSLLACGFHTAATYLPSLHVCYPLVLRLRVMSVLVLPLPSHAA